MGFQLKPIAPPAEVIWRSTKGPATDVASFDYWMDTEISTMTVLAIDDLTFTTDANQSTFAASSLSGAEAFTQRDLSGGGSFAVADLSGGGSFSVKDLS